MGSTILTDLTNFRAAIIDRICQMWMRRNESNPLPALSLPTNLGNLNTPRYTMIGTSFIQFVFLNRIAGQRPLLIFNTTIEPLHNRGQLDHRQGSLILIL